MSVYICVCSHREDMYLMHTHIYAHTYWSGLVNQQDFFLGNTITGYLHKVRYSETLHPTGKSHSQGTKFENESLKLLTVKGGHWPKDDVQQASLVNHWPWL